MASHTSSPEARSRAVTKYVKNNYERIEIRLPKGEKAPIVEHAEKMGESVNQFIKRAVSETIERDNLK